MQTEPGAPPRRSLLRSLSLSCALATLLACVVGMTWAGWSVGETNPDNHFATAATYLPPTNDAPPAISGIARHGQTLTATSGSWSGAGHPFSFEWQWMRCDASGEACADISGATGNTYEATQDDVPGDGRTLRVRVTATSAYGSQSAESAPTAVVQAAPPANLTPPTISGTARENRTLTVTSPGTWSGTTPISFIYQWERCNSAGASCVNIAGVNGTTYIVNNDDQGHTLRARVYALNGGGIGNAPSAVTELATPVDETPHGGYATDGFVTAMVRSGGNTYFGGEFTMVGRPTGSFARTSLEDGRALTSTPVATGGYVNAIESDGAGGWFVGGSFTSIGGIARARIAHVLADGSVDQSWNPGASDSVFHMELIGGTLYVGGRFTTIAGQPRSRIAALNAATGAATGWNPGVDGDVYTLTPNGTTTMYVGGSYNNIAGVGRTNLAELNLASGTATSLAPQPNGPILSIVRTGSTLYFSGTYTQVGAVARGNVASVNLPAGTLNSWNPNANGRVREVAVVASTVYLGGEFTTVGGASHPALAGVSTTTGAVTWNPPDPAGTYGAFGTGVWVFHVIGSTIYVGGEFTTVGGSPRRGLAAFSTTTGALQAWWAPQTNGPVRTAVVDGDDLLVGGVPTGTAPFMLNTVERTNAAALGPDGEPTAWNPQVGGGPVLAITAAEGKAYLGGAFTTVGGQPRSNIAATNLTTGAVDPWNPGANGYIRALATNGTVVYMGGEFTATGGQSRTRLAAYSGTTAAPASWWAPVANGPVLTLHVTPLGIIYAGGAFTTIDGIARGRGASIAPFGTTLYDWNPNADGVIRSIYVPPVTSAIYFGGDFTTVGSTPRNRIAATDSSGAPTAWNPNADGLVLSVHGYGQTVWATGTFTTIGGQARQNLAGLRVSDGTANAWNPGPDSIGYDVLPDETGVYLGGNHLMMGAFAPQGYAFFP